MLIFLTSFNGYPLCFIKPGDYLSCLWFDILFVFIILIFVVIISTLLIIFRSVESYYFCGYLLAFDKGKCNLSFLLGVLWLSRNGFRYSCKNTKIVVLHKLWHGLLKNSILQSKVSRVDWLGNFLCYMLEIRCWSCTNNKWLWVVMKILTLTVHTTWNKFTGLPNQSTLTTLFKGMMPCADTSRNVTPVSVHIILFLLHELLGL